MLRILADAKNSVIEMMVGKSPFLKNKLKKNEPPNKDKMLGRMTKLRNLVCQISPNKRHDNNKKTAIMELIMISKMKLTVREIRVIKTQIQNSNILALTTSTFREIILLNLAYHRSCLFLVRHLAQKSSCLIMQELTRS